MGTESSFQSYLPFKVDSLAELAALAGMDLDQLFRRHTIGPYMRAVTRDLVPVNLQGRRAPALNSKLRNSSTWGGLRFCPDCVKRDLDRHGVAYWRRMHLLPGVFWCSVHGTALVRPDIKTTFVQEPGLHLLAEDDLKFDEKRLCDVHPAIQRYVHLAMLTLRRCHSVGTTTISARLKSLVFEAEMTASTSRLLNDAVRNAYPDDWLKKTVPQRIGVGRSGRAASDWYKMTVVWEKPRATERYLILAAALCSDARWLGEMLFAPELDPRIALAEKMGRSNACNALIEAAAASIASTGQAKTNRALLGTSDCESASNKNVEKAFVSFLGGLSVGDACASHQAERGQLEELLRDRLVSGPRGQVPRRH